MITRAAAKRVAETDGSSLRSTDPRPLVIGDALTTAKWIGTATGVTGAVVIALNLGMVVFGFGLFLISSILWTVAGWRQREASLVVLQGTFTVINLVGIYRWIGA